MKSIFVWLGGHNPKSVADEPETANDIAKLGGIVLMATFVGMLGWSVAGWTYLPPDLRPWSAVLGGLVGAFIVLLADRAFIYYADAREMGWWTSAGWLLLRLVISLLIGSLTAQAMMPLLLRSELRAHALVMLDRDEKTRFAALSDRLQVPAKLQSAASAADALTDARKAAAAPLPRNVQQQLDRATACWAEHRRFVDALPASPDADGGSVVAERIRASAARCAAIAADAKARQTRHEALVQGHLRDAQAAFGAAQSALQAATSVRENRTRQAREQQAEALVPESATVLADMLHNDTAARMKWLALSALLTLLELLPMCVKAIAGRTLLGERLVRDRRIRTLELNAATDEAEIRAQSVQALAAASRQGLEEALATPEVRQHFAASASTNLRATQPLEAVVALARQYERCDREVQQHMTRHPSHHAIANAFADAIRQAAGAIAQPLGAAPTPAT